MTHSLGTETFLGMDFALLISAFGFGIRHGFDWDHIAAISDIATSEKNPKKAFSLSTAYAFGHAAVVVLLGVGIILADFTIPDSVNTTMMYLIGGSLIALGLWVLVNVVVQGENFRLRSRWMIILSGAFRGLQRVRRSAKGRTIIVEHAHTHLHRENIEIHDHSHDNHQELGEKEIAGHHHRHRHEILVEDSAMKKSTASGVGILHGIGLETPTQIAIFVATTQASGKMGGLLILGAWVTGLLVANSSIAIVSVNTSNWVQQHLRVYRWIAAVVGLLSLIVGVLVCIKQDDLLPVF
ncbi:MAG: hypothetical protein VYB80_02710 [Actinomycetota bacterium]|nr:hypothetical protein [Actinomycetota bacterium]